MNKKIGATYRATVIIDPNGIVVSKMLYPSDVGRNAYEILRVMEALIFTRETGLGAPANWQPGDFGIEKDFKMVGRI